MLYLTTVLDFFLHCAEIGSILGKNLKGKGTARMESLKNLENKGEV
jgi:hypothetical protein